MKKIAIIGATGLVGRTILKVIHQTDFPSSEIILVASSASVGKIIHEGNNEYKVVSLEKAVEMRPDIALFSAGSEISSEWAPKFAEIGCRVVDNSSRWRMDGDKKLIIPQVNGIQLSCDDMIIANPNCSTIQMLIALAPLHREYKIKRIVVSTYQSVSGSGKRAIDRMEEERVAWAEKREPNESGMVYKYPIDMNLIPQIDSFTENGYTKEEMKMINETHKILSNYSIEVSPTTVRVPVSAGHSESVNVEFEKRIDISEVKKILSSSPQIVLRDDPDNFIYPMPIDVAGRDEVFVGRIREDLFKDNTLNMWIVADNLRVGAATNAVGIARLLMNFN